MSEENEESEALPEGCFARIEVYDSGVRVTLREGMPSTEFAEMLRTIADAFEEGPVRRVE